jgi:hypothetical protein
MHTALIFELRQRSANVTAGKMGDDFLQGRILLALDLLESRDGDAGFLRLRVRPSSLYRFVLARVADEKHAIVRPQSSQKRVHLRVRTRLDSSST